MKNQKVIKLNEQDIEMLVKKIIKEEDDNGTTLTRHPAYPIIDELESKLDEYKANFKREIANKVSGTDGYHSEIDKFTSDFNKFIGKVSDLKGKINDYEIQSTSKRKDKRAEDEKKRQHNERKNQASQDGNNYSY